MKFYGVFVEDYESLGFVCLVWKDLYYIWWGRGMVT